MGSGAGSHATGSRAGNLDSMRIRTRAEKRKTNGAMVSAPRSETLPRAGALEADAIRVRGARVHNLKNLDCEIPQNRITVVTGVSGSGKSSLVFDTIYAEGQRRYIESLSAYARQFLERIEKPDVDDISGIAPPIAIRQKNTTRTPRSTVATATEIYDYLRLLYARIGTVCCRKCGRVVARDTVDEVAERILALPEGTRLYLLFPVPLEGRKTPAVRNGRASKKVRFGPRSISRAAKKIAAELEDHPAARLEALRKKGFDRFYQKDQAGQKGEMVDLDETDPLAKIDLASPLFALVDRLVVRQENRQRLADSVELCYRETGEAIVEIVDSSERLVFNERFECKDCKIAYEEPEPRLFSFNNPYGACPRCQGFGNTIDYDLRLVIPDPRRTLAEGAVDPWTKPRYRSWLKHMKQFAEKQGVPLDVPYAKLSGEQKRWLEEGGGGFRGIQGFFKYLERKKYKLHIRVFLSRFRGYALCPVCRGGRLRTEALQVKIHHQNITDVCRLSIAEVQRFFLEIAPSPTELRVAEKVLEEVRSRLKFLCQVGLEYLTLDRLTSTLSGGESQRIQLANSLGSTLVGTLYVLDEPSIGLHARDTERLISILKNLRDLGNTILVVEHDPDVMCAADTILDLGPGAGEQGGHIVCKGSYEEVKRDERSLTGRYLSGELEILVPAERRIAKQGEIQIFGARQHNLKNLDVAIPLGVMTCVTGVSGSGKSTLVHDVLYHALRRRRGVAGPRPQLDRMSGDKQIGEVILVDQSPLGRTPRSNPVTYMKAFDGIRELFAGERESRRRGYKPGTFSFNIPGGRCETCQGDGTVTVEMQFLADVELICEECRGRRYKSEVLAIRYKGKNIHDVLQMTVKEAIRFFAAAPRVKQKLKVLDEIGLGYLRLGQSATTLSGGEAQRVRLGSYLARQSRERCLFLFDEPTTGLHFDDIHKLLRAFRKLVDARHTVLIIEHNMDVIKTADWILDLGPEGGEAGGSVVAVGTPEQVMKNPRSFTGRTLVRYLGQSAATVRVQ